MDDAKQVSNAVALIAHVGRQVTELFDYIDSKILAGDLHSSLKVAKLKARAHDEDYLDDEGEWVCKRLVKNYALLKGKAKKATSYFGYQIELDGEFLGIGEPVLHVFGNWKCPAGCDPDSEDSATIESTISEDDDYKLAVYNDTLLQWWDRATSDTREGDQISELGWLFAVRLGALGSPEVVDQLILEPMKNLLTSKSTALKFDHSGYLKVAMHEGRLILHT